MVDQLTANCLVTGGQGTIGSSLPFGRKLGRNELDVTNVEQIRRVITHYRPSLIIHPAALTDVDYCQTHPQEAYRVNVIGTYNLAREAQIHHTWLMVISTGAVFPGTGPASVNDLPRPINVYGRTKYLAELAAQDCNPLTLIVRTGWVFGSLVHPKFIELIAQKIQTGRADLKVLRGYSGCPTWSVDFGKGLQKLLNRPRPGIYHLVNRGTVSRCQLARTMIKLSGKSLKVIPVSNHHFSLQAPRPKREILLPTPPHLRPWQTALKAYLHQEFAYDP
jgi:dTDP-4-dehydrorhamnose reductase